MVRTWWRWSVVRVHDRPHDYARRVYAGVLLGHGGRPPPAGPSSAEATLGTKGVPRHHPGRVISIVAGARHHLRGEVFAAFGWGALGGSALLVGARSIRALEDTCRSSWRACTGSTDLSPRSRSRTAARCCRQR